MVLDGLFGSADDIVLDALGGKSLKRSYDLIRPGGRIVALLQARVLGCAFNPVNLYWCHDRAGLLRHVVVEMHHVRGERHAYLLPPADTPVRGGRLGSAGAYAAGATRGARSGRAPGTALRPAAATGGRWPL